MPLHLVSLTCDIDRVLHLGSSGRPPFVEPPNLTRLLRRQHSLRHHRIVGRNRDARHLMVRRHMPARHLYVHRFVRLAPLSGRDGEEWAHPGRKFRAFEVRRWISVQPLRRRQRAAHKVQEYAQWLATDPAAPGLDRLGEAFWGRSPGSRWHRSVVGGQTTGSDSVLGRAPTPRPWQVRFRRSRVARYQCSSLSGLYQIDTATATGT